MSLEQAISENTAALRELMATIAKQSATLGASDTATPAPKPEKPAKKEAEAKKTDAPSTGTTKESTESAAPSGTGESTGQSGPTYDDVKVKILTLSKEKGREPTVALMARHGVQKGPDLKPSQYAEFIADVDAILAGTYDPEAAELA